VPDFEIPEPHIEQRNSQSYVAIPASVTMETIGQVIPQLIPEVFDWLGAKGINPSGPPFTKYNVIDMERLLEIEVGVPVADDVEGGGRVLAGSLPAGRYLSVRYAGHPNTMVDAVGAFRDWASSQELMWAMVNTDQGEQWDSRLEFYWSDPDTEPDLDLWVTEFAFMLAP
jgi:effector-binding domain-containing protein